MIRSSFYSVLTSLVFSTTHLWAQSCQLDPPDGLYVSEITSCEATLHWNANVLNALYSVSYKASTSSTWSANIQAGKDTFYRFSGLSPAKNYTFAVKSKCPDGSSSKKQKISAITAQCSLPEQVTVEPLNSHAAKITVTSSCPYSYLRVKYKALKSQPKILAFPLADSYTVDGLSSDSTYLFQVSTCPPSLNWWTPVDTLHLLSPPNIIFIIIDDSRSDYFSCNGGPAFAPTPNIDRIANEGVNFKKSFVVTSLCQPSRSSIATGLFPLKTGVTENGIALDPNFVTIPKVLNDENYYTALIGKNHEVFLQGEEPEFDFYMVFDKYAAFDGQKFDYNGAKKIIDKNYVLTLTDTAMALMQRVDDPLFIWLAYVVPHYPAKPMPSFAHRYDDDIIPWKADTAAYKVNYPSFIDDGDLLYGEELDTTYRNVLEEIAGLDSCIGEIFKVLESTGKLDNTMIIFTSDNGFMMGSHRLNGKTLGYDPSMRVPLFIRYPEWFPAASNVTDQFALNLDLTPTIYQATGATYDLPLDGTSLKKIYDNDFSRKEFYYLMLHNAGANDPTIRAVRDSYFKYIRYTCNPDTVEELFDMKNDSLELTNLINNHNYDAIAQTYRLKYDSIKVAWGDTIVGPVKSCYIENPFVLKQLFESEEEIPEEPVVYPSLTDGHIEIYIPWPSAFARLYDDLGAPIIDWNITEPFTQIILPALPDGMYYMNISYADGSVTRKLMLQHR